MNSRNENIALRRRFNALVMNFEQAHPYLFLLWLSLISISIFYFYLIFNLSLSIYNSDLAAKDELPKIFSQDTSAFYFRDLPSDACQKFIVPIILRDY